ncbi:uncharacterized protein LJ206_011984 isoform 2-T2 [Theristicus caerulescens]
MFWVLKIRLQRELVSRHKHTTLPPTTTHSSSKEELVAGADGPLHSWWFHFINAAGKLILFHPLIIPGPQLPQSSASFWKKHLNLR